MSAPLLLLSYAFETLAVARVDLKTDARNQRSRQAIERLGARSEGVLRTSLGDRVGRLKNAVAG
jgi:N-acetyltransferase